MDEQGPKVVDPPDTIWLVYGDLDTDTTHAECNEVAWCEEAQFFSDVKYVRADFAEMEIRKKTLLDLWDALPAHEASGDCAGSLRAILLLSEVGDEIRKTRLSL